VDYGEHMLQADTGSMLYASTILDRKPLSCTHMHADRARGSASFRLAGKQAGLSHSDSLTLTPCCTVTVCCSVTGCCSAVAVLPARSLLQCWQLSCQHSMHALLVAVLPAYCCSTNCLLLQHELPAVAALTAHCLLPSHSHVCRVWRDFSLSLLPALASLSLSHSLTCALALVYVVSLSLLLALALVYGVASLSLYYLRSLSCMASASAPAKMS
jgi:hypothetical protein